MSKDSNLRVEFFESVEKELSFLSNYLHVTKTQALLMAVIFTLNYKGRKVDLDDLNSYFNCNPLKLLEYSDDFVELYEKQLLLKNQRGHRRHRRFQLFGTDEEFSINEIIINKILKSETIPETLIIEEKFEDIFSLFEKVYELGGDYIRVKARAIYFT